MELRPPLQPVPPFLLALPFAPRRAGIQLKEQRPAFDASFAASFALLPIGDGYP